MNKGTILILAALLIIGGALYYSGKHTMDLVYPEEYYQDIALNTFASEKELTEFLKSAQDQGSYSYGLGGRDMLMMEQSSVPMAQAESTAKAGGGAEEYSTTNIQVEGVDEADIIKNDGKYIYIISGNKVIIVDAFPAKNAEILSEIEFDDDERISQIFINENKLIVFGQKNEKEHFGDVNGEPEEETPVSSKMMAEDVMMWPYPSYTQLTFAYIYDISDRSDPEIIDDIEVKGNYYNSRMIGDYVYLIANENVWFRDGPVPLPMMRVGGMEKIMPATDIMYCPIPDYSYSYTNILAINTQKEKDVTHKVVLKGNSQQMYMSTDNLYLTSMKQMRWYDQRWRILEKTIIPFLPKDITNKIESLDPSDLADYTKWSDIEEMISDYTDSLTPTEEKKFAENVQEKAEDVEKEIMKETERTVVHRISIDKDKIEYEAEGEFPGRLLNQFSMDEYDGHFRAATTVGRASTRSGEETSSNNVYVLDMDLNIVGEVEDLAPGEKIYSARFMGKKGYLVTFRNIDPLFVIDLSIPKNPKVLGKLKIPGYSDYLHPYDENHLIGLGKQTIAAKDRDFAWYQGVKLSLFDVSDVSKPKEVAKYEIGDRGTDSNALNDHKAFLFDKNKNLLVIPITLAEIDEEKYPSGISDNQYGDYTFQGAYVFHIDTNSIDLKGRISHIEDYDSYLKSGYRYFNYDESVKRSLYMDDVLYTVSNKFIKMNDLDDLDELNTVELPYEEQRYYGYGGGEVPMVDAVTV
ncbi:MAG: beta-propeller domain-containing protein [Nanoarchaeota archaeon]|nr:beta-propeller domain-containing protein [Nanoarchaeota archaeon]